MSSYQGFTESLFDIIVLLLKALIVGVIIRCGLILLNYNVHIPILDPALSWIIFKITGSYPIL